MHRAPAAALALLVLSLPTVGAQSSLPSPESVLGYRVGADYKVATYDETVAYLQKLDAASERMVMMRAGTSTQGRPYWMAAISSTANLARLDRYREIARRLAHPADLSEADARQLAREGRAIVHIDGGLHSTAADYAKFIQMILNDGATVPVNFGGRVVWEADMLLVVKDGGINAAKTPEDAVKHIRAMRPFIELPDLALDPKEKLDGVQLAAINVARCSIS